MQKHETECKYYLQINCHQTQKLNTQIYHTEIKKDAINPHLSNLQESPSL